MKKLWILVPALIWFPLMAQVEMADQLRSSGKIYGVLAVILIIFIGMIGFLVVQDRRLSKLEEKLKNKQNPES